jgi:hypothetical protein
MKREREECNWCVRFEEGFYELWSEYRHFDEIWVNYLGDNRVLCSFHTDHFDDFHDQQKNIYFCIGCSQGNHTVVDYFIRSGFRSFCCPENPTNKISLSVKYACRRDQQDILHKLIQYGEKYGDLNAFRVWESPLDICFFFAENMECAELIWENNDISSTTLTNMIIRYIHYRCQKTVQFILTKDPGKIDIRCLWPALTTQPYNDDWDYIPIVELIHKIFPNGHNLKRDGMCLLQRAIKTNMFKLFVWLLNHDLALEQIYWYQDQLIDGTRRDKFSEYFVENGFYCLPNDFPSF